MYKPNTPMVVWMLLACLLLCSCAEEAEKKPKKELTVDEAYAEYAKELDLKPFPREEHDRVVAYKMSGKMTTVVHEGMLSSQVLDDGKELTTDEADRLVSLLNTRNTYGGMKLRCFEPHLGYVFYRGFNIVAHATVCMECNWVHTDPELGGEAFSRIGRLAMKAFEADLYGVEPQ